MPCLNEEEALGVCLEKIRSVFEREGIQGEIIVADNGSAWYLSGVPDDRWDNDILRQLRQIEGADFEAVDVTSLVGPPADGGAGAVRTRPGSGSSIGRPNRLGP